MKYENIGIKRTEVKFWLTPEQAAALDAILAPMGAKRGPFAKALVLRELQLRRFQKAEPDARP